MGSSLSGILPMEGPEGDCEAYMACEEAFIRGERQDIAPDCEKEEG